MLPNSQKGRISGTYCESRWKCYGSCKNTCYYGLALSDKFYGHATFLGLASHYWRIVSGFAATAVPLHRPLSKDEWYNRTKKCESSLLSTPIFTYPISSESFIIDVDGSGTRASYCVLQSVIIKSWKVLLCQLNQLLELVAVCRQFKEYSGRASFVTRTDHNCLRWLKNFSEPKGQVVWWLEILTEFNMTIEHWTWKNDGDLL